MGIVPTEKNRQECWSGLPFPPPGDLPNPSIEPRSPTLQADYLPSEPPWKPWWSKNTKVHVSLQSMIFSWYISRGLQLFKKIQIKKLPRKRHIGQSQRKCETWNFGLLFPGCHGQLCVHSTDVPAVSTCRHGSSLQAPCPEILLGLHRWGMTDGPYSWSQTQTSLEVQVILHDQNPHPESHHSCGPRLLL